MGTANKQDGINRFANRNNDPYNWDIEQSPLIEDNAPEPDPATFPDIPTKIPGVILDANVPAIKTPPPPPKEQLMEDAVMNAGIKDEFGEFRFQGNPRNVEHH